MYYTILTLGVPTVDLAIRGPASRSGQQRLGFPLSLQVGFRARYLLYLTPPFVTG